MTIRQTTMWTVLPHGVRTDRDGSRYLQLSAITSPRLDSSTEEMVLGDYPDFVTPDPARNWASTVKGLSFNLEVKNSHVLGQPKKFPARSVRRRTQAEPELWARLFSTSTRVKAHVVPDFTRLAVNSFSVKSAAIALQTHYAQVAAKPSLAYKIPSPKDLLTPNGLVDSPLLAHLTPAVRAQISATAPKAAAVTAQQRFEAFHGPFLDAQGNVRRLTSAQLAARIAEQQRTDFHKAVSALGQYPDLMRRLGIVVDFEVKFDASIASVLSGADRIRLVVDWPAGAAPVPRNTPCPWTALGYRSRTVNRVVVPTKFEALSKNAELQNGYLVVRDATTTGSGDPVVLANVDIDAAAMRSYSAIAEIARDYAAYATQRTVTRQGADAEAAATFIPKTPSSIKAALPTLGHSVLSFSITNAGVRLSRQLSETARKNALLAQGQTDEIVHYAEELVRGYRVDVWDSTTKMWHRLCQRAGTYETGTRDDGRAPILWDGKAEHADEGWVQLAPVSAPDADPNAPDELRLHEQLFSWNGWSLVVPRPGAALAEVDPAKGVTKNEMTRTYLDQDGNPQPLADFDNEGLPLTVTYHVPRQTLPRLRFGTSYRFRARAVDLAGNSAAFSAGSPTTPPGGSSDTLQTVTREITHKRYEPVRPPTVVITEAMRTGESPQVLVIRSDYNTKPTEVTSRHICPPRTSFTMAEGHGGFEKDTDGRPLDGSEQRHTMIAARDLWDFPKDLANKNQQEPMAAVPQPLPYLPDVPARGAAFSGLPGQQKTITSVVTIPSKTPMQRAVKIPVSSRSTTTVSSLRVPFNVGTSAWYNRTPLKLVVKGIEGLDPRLDAKDAPAAPAWNATKRELTVELAKAEQVTVEVSSYVSAADLKVLGMYQWGVTESMRSTGKTVSGTPRMLMPVMTPKFTYIPTVAKTALSIETNALINTTILGRNWTVTPAEKITLVHPVRRPMLAPNLTTHLKATRQSGETTAVLSDWVQIHGKSTGRIALNGKWTEDVDDPALGTPKYGATALQRSGQAFDIGVARSDVIALSLGKPLPRGVLAPAGTTNSVKDPLMQRHSFGDTKHRKVTYQLTASSRFAQYFPPDTPIARTGTERTIHVPSSARPVAPEVDIVIPAFKWVRSADGSSSQRDSGRLRVYLKRPWFSSGDDEKLAVIIFEPTLRMLGYEQMQRYVTEWGEDPVFRSPGHLPANYISAARFLGAGRKVTGLKLAENSGHAITVVPYQVDFDAETNRWFADIEIDQGNAYFPFVKLALARYQPYSLAALELSTVTVVDAVQLAPDRSAAVSWSGTSLTVSVNGRSYEAARSGVAPKVTMTVERRLGEKYAWVPVTLSGQSSAEIALTSYLPSIKVYGDVRTYWKKTLDFAGQDAAYEYRAVIREYETHLTGGPDSEMGERPVYVDVLPVVKPA